MDHKFQKFSDKLHVQSNYAAYIETEGLYV